VGEFNSWPSMRRIIHISYWDGDLWALKYAHDDGSGWITETVDSAGYIDWYPTPWPSTRRSTSHLLLRVPYYSECTELRYAWYDGALDHETVIARIRGYASSWL